MTDSTHPVKILLLMGVSGSGKTTLGRLLSDQLHWPFHDGDDYHPPANVAKMRSGIPLTDADRAPWLTAIAADIRAHLDRGQSAIFACSALKSAYRDILRVDPRRVIFVHLRGDRDLLQSRLQQRKGHYMPATLLDSQIQTLQDPGEDAVTIDVGPPAPLVAQEIRRRLGIDPLNQNLHFT